MTQARRLDPQRVLSDAFRCVTTAHDLVRAAGQFLRHNPDTAINDLEPESRVASLLTVIRENPGRLQTDLDKAYWT